MSEDHLEALLSLTCDQSSCLRLSKPIFDKLRLPSNLKLAIEGEKSEAEKKKKFLRILSKRPDHDYVTFIQWLRDSQQNEVLDILQPGLCSLFTSMPFSKYVSFTNSNLYIIESRLAFYICIKIIYNYVNIDMLFRYLGIYLIVQIRSPKHAKCMPLLHINPLAAAIRIPVRNT